MRVVRGGRHEDAEGMHPVWCWGWLWLTFNKSGNGVAVAVATGMLEGCIHFRGG
tara:strand:- start:5098 stop:5259 length:162 start_codon:yes stop_codon:yes gene_type:complete